MWLTRNYAATVNGLVDGWRAPYGFHAHLTEHGWWKFDMPPGWRRYVDAPIMEKAWFQWVAANEHIRDHIQNRPCLRVKFGEFRRHPRQVLHRICRFAGIAEPADASLPPTMVTEPPRPGRWRDRAEQILPYSTRERTRSLMVGMGYTMEQDTWD